MKERMNEVIDLNKMKTLDALRFYRPVCRTCEKYLDKCMNPGLAEDIAYKHYIDSGRKCAVGCLTC